MNGIGSTLTTPQTSSTSPPAAYDADEHAEHLRNTYGLPSVEQPGGIAVHGFDGASQLWEDAEKWL